MAMDKALYHYNLIISIISTILCIFILVWFVWNQFCPKRCKKSSHRLPRTRIIIHHDMNNSNSSNTANSITNSRVIRNRCDSYSCSTQTKHRDNNNNNGNNNNNNNNLAISRSHIHSPSISLSSVSASKSKSPIKCHSNQNSGSASNSVLNHPQIIPIICTVEEEEKHNDHKCATYPDKVCQTDQIIEIAIIDDDNDINKDNIEIETKIAEHDKELPNKDKKEGFPVKYTNNNIPKRRDSFVNFKETARRLSQVFGHSDNISSPPTSSMASSRTTTSIKKEKTDKINDKWILVAVHFIFICYIMSCLFHVSFIYFIGRSVMFTDTDDDDDGLSDDILSSYTHYGSYVFHILARFATFWLFFYLLFYVVYNKKQQTVNLYLFSISNTSNNPDDIGSIDDIKGDIINNQRMITRRYIVCGCGKPLLLVFCMIFVIGCFIAIIDNSWYEFIISYLVYAIFDCLYLILFGMKCFNIHYCAYKEFKSRYEDDSFIGLNDAATIYSGNVLDAGIKSVVIIFVICITHLMLIITMISTQIWNVQIYHGNDQEMMRGTIVNTIYLSAVIINCLSIALIFKYSQWTYNLCCLWHKYIMHCLL